MKSSDCFVVVGDVGDVCFQSNNLVVVQSLDALKTIKGFYFGDVADLMP